MTFDWDRERWKDRGFDAGWQIGFIAQEVEKVLPELVSTDANVVPVLVEAVKALNGKGEMLTKANLHKDSEIAELRVKMDTIAASLAEPKAQKIQEE